MWITLSARIFRKSKDRVVGMLLGALKFGLICHRHMQMETEEVEKTALLLQKNWDVVVPAHLDWESLRVALETQLKYMLEQDFERLVQTMYRLDVAEAKFTAALNLPTVQARAIALAGIVIDRELQRLATWKKYSG
jgi:hypothetical protein